MNKNNIDQDELINFMKSLADVERLKIAGLLGVEALTSAQIAEKLGISESVAQGHLEQLVASGLAHNEAGAFRLDKDSLEKRTRQVLAQSHPPAPAYEGDEFEVKTLRSYLSRDGTLKSIPNQHRKLMVILNHLVKDFQPGTRYTESQVNQMLRRYHEDTAALRRYMADNGVIKRERGIYWREDTTP